MGRAPGSWDRRDVDDVEEPLMGATGDGGLPKGSEQGKRIKEQQGDSENED